MPEPEPEPEPELELDDFNLNNEGYRIINFQNDEQTIISETNELVNLIENFQYMK